MEKEFVKFEGLLIPKAIVFEPSLRLKHKLILAEIVRLAGINGECTATNKHFARIVNQTEGSASSAIRELKLAGWVFAYSVWKTRHLQPNLERIY